MEKYSEESALCKFRTRMMGGSPFINYGIVLNGEIPTDMRSANINMITWLIKELGITETSHVLEMGSGRGGYILGIAEKTGCSYVGVDLLPQFVAESRAHAKRRGLEGQGSFYEGSYQNCPEVLATEIKKKKFTHVICIGSLYYAHDEVDLCLESMWKVAGAETKIMIWDFNRMEPWDNCRRFVKHMRLSHRIISQSQMLNASLGAKLRVLKMEDLTAQMLPCLKIMNDAALEEDPTSEIITFPHVYEAFLHGEVVYPAYTLKKIL